MLSANLYWFLAALASMLQLLTWPGTAMPVLLAPAFILGLEPLFQLQARQYLAIMLIAAFYPLASKQFTLAFIILFQFLLWYGARRRGAWARALGSALPPLLLGALPAADRILFGIPLSLQIAALQLLLHDLLLNLSGRALAAWEQRHGDSLYVNKVLNACGQWQQMQAIDPLLHSLDENTEAIYQIYQNAEMLARSRSSIPPELAQELLAEAQETHQKRLQLTAWYQEQFTELVDGVGSKPISLSNLCRMLASYITAKNKNNCRVKIHLNFPDPFMLQTKEQLPLAALLLQVCQLGLEKLAANEASIYFNSYGGPAGIRIVIILTSQTQEPSNQWPSLQPYPLGAYAGFADYLNACCRHGLTDGGEHIYTIELV